MDSLHKMSVVGILPSRKVTAMSNTLRKTLGGHLARRTETCTATPAQTVSLVFDKRDVMIIYVSYIIFF